MGGGGVVLHDRLFGQVDRRWVDGMRLLLLLCMGEVGRFVVTTGGLLPITGDKTSQEP